MILNCARRRILINHKNIVVSFLKKLYIRTFFFVLFTTICAVKNIFAADTFVQIKVRNASEKFVTLSYAESDTLERFFKIDLDAQSSTHFVFDLKNPIWAILRNGLHEEMIFIQPSDDFSIIFSGDKDDVLKPIFGGTTAKDNRFYQQMIEKFHSNPIVETPSEYLKTFIDRPTYAQAHNYSATQFNALVRRRFDVAMDLLYEHKGDINRYLFSYLFRFEQYTLQRRLYSYFVFHDFEDAAEMRAAQAVISIQTFTFTGELRQNEPFVADAIKMFAHVHAKNFGVEPQKLYATIAAIGTTKQIYSLLLKLLEQTLSSQKDRSFAAQKWESFVSNCSDKSLIKRLNELMISHGEFETKFRLAPNFNFTLPDNTVHQLSDYNGRVVMVSFWASWCSACLTNFKNTASIRHDLQKNGVVLLNINLDEDINAYKNILQELKMEGITAQPNVLEQVKSAYEVEALPHYVFIDKQNQMRISENHTETAIQKICTHLLNN